MTFATIVWRIYIYVLLRYSSFKCFFFSFFLTPRDFAILWNDKNREGFILTRRSRCFFASLSLSVCLFLCSLLSFFSLSRPQEKSVVKRNSSSFADFYFVSALLYIYTNCGHCDSYIFSRKKFTFHLFKSTFRWLLKFETFTSAIVKKTIQ